MAAQAYSSTTITPAVPLTVLSTPIRSTAAQIPSQNDSISIALPTNTAQQTTLPQVATSNVQAASPTRSQRMRLHWIAAIQSVLSKFPAESNHKSLVQWLFNLAILGLTVLGIAFAYIQLSLSSWTANKDFRDDCFNQKQVLGIFSPTCNATLSREFTGPPTFPGLSYSKRSVMWTSHMHDTGHSWSRICAIALEFLICIAPAYAKNLVRPSLLDNKTLPSTHLSRRGVRCILLLCGDLCILIIFYVPQMLLDQRFSLGVVYRVITGIRLARSALLPTNSGLGNNYPASAAIVLDCSEAFLTATIRMILLHPVLRHFLPRPIPCFIGIVLALPLVVVLKRPRLLAGIFIITVLTSIFSILNLPAFIYLESYLEVLNYCCFREIDAARDVIVKDLKFFYGRDLHLPKAKDRKFFRGRGLHPSNPLKEATSGTVAGFFRSISVFDLDAKMRRNWVQTTEIYNMLYYNEFVRYGLLRYGISLV